MTFCPRKLEVEGLSLSWDGLAICSDVSLEVGEGQCVCMVGRSGCGKTTIFHAIAGLVEPDSGKVLLDGDDITGRPGRISYMFQKDLLLDQHTVIDNVCMPLVVGGVKRSEARRQAFPLFAQFGIDGSQTLYPAQLSGGMRQRAALLRTYMMRNEVVLADEPFSALDAFTRQEMRAWFLRMLTELKMTAMLVTHDVDEAVEMADRILVLEGDPAKGVPSRITADVSVECPRKDRERFALSDEALQVKRRVLGLLGYSL